MEGKEIRFGTKARESMLSGINTLANAVKSTLGPSGKNVVIMDKRFPSPRVTKDGVTVARNIVLTDKFENMGAQMMREVASKTVDIAGDGTTTATVLAQSLISEGSQAVVAGSNSREVKAGIEQAVSVVVSELKKQSQKVTAETLKQVSKVSANGDEEIAETVSEAVSSVSEDGVVTVEESGGLETTRETINGMRFQAGYLSPYFINHQSKSRVEFKNPKILIYDKKINSIDQIVGVLEQVAQAGHPLLIIAEDIDGGALSTLVVNKVHGNLLCAAIKAPWVGKYKTDCMGDIATLTASEVISEDFGVALKDLKVGHLGSAGSVTITRESTTIIGGSGNKEDISKRCEEIKSLISSGELDEGLGKNRISNLNGGIVVVKVGATTESEMKEKKDRIEDAICAARCAVHGGVVCGGGVALIRCLDAVSHLSLQSQGQMAGIDVVKKALEAPLRSIAENAGMDANEVLERVKEGSGGFGYDAATNKYGDLMSIGILDPTEVVISAIQHAASIAGLILTTEVMIADAEAPSIVKPA